MIASNGGVKVIPKTRSVSLMSMVTSRGFLMPVAMILSALVDELTIHGCFCRFVMAECVPVGIKDVIGDIGVDDTTAAVAAAGIVAGIVVVAVAVAVVAIEELDSDETTCRVEPMA